MNGGLFSASLSLDITSRKPVIILVLTICWSIFAVSDGCAAESLAEIKFNSLPIAPLVQVNVNRHPVNLLLDLGSSGVTMDSSVSEYLGPVEKSTAVKVGGESLITVEHSPASLSVDGIEFERTKIAEMNLDSIKSFGLGAQGILGCGPLRTKAVEVSFTDQRIRIWKEFDQKADGWRVADLRMASSIPEVQLELENQASNFVIDTGADDVMGLSGTLFDKLIASKVILIAGDSRAAGVVGVEVNRTGYFNKGALLGVNLNGKRVLRLTKDDQNYIGMQFLINLDFAIDFGRGKFHYKNRSVDPPIRPDLIIGGFLLYDRGDAVVVNVEKGGPLDRVGIKVGDIISRVGDLRTGGLNVSSLYLFCLQHRGESFEVDWRSAHDPERKSAVVTSHPEGFAYHKQ